MIGRLVLSGKNNYKNNSKSGRKCYILSEKLDDIIIQTKKEFNTSDSYISLKLNSNIIDQELGKIGNENDDLNIYFNIYTINWMSNTQYNKLWSKYKEENINWELFDCDDKIRINYDKEVLTIDPIGSIDLDDGFTFSHDNDKYYLDIHIADPISYFDFTTISMLTIFKELITRINTCYIPNPSTGQAYHLLPPQLINLISLTNSQTPKRAQSFCFQITKSNNDVSFKIESTYLTNIRNTTYEMYDKNINSYDKNIMIELILKLMLIMNLKHTIINPIDDVSHTMIEIFMIWVNYYVGNYLNTKSDYIVRTQNKFEINDIHLKIPKYTINFLNYAATYQFIQFNYDQINTYEHNTLGINNYAHVSSPMRRVIDMINHLAIHNINFINIIPFINISDINTQISKQKKISNAYNLLKYIKINYKFIACIMDITILDNRTNLLLVIYDHKTDFKSMITVESPLEYKSELYKFMELNVEIFYSSHNFISNKFPFSIKIISIITN